MLSYTTRSCIANSETPQVVDFTSCPPGLGGYTWRSSSTPTPGEILAPYNTPAHLAVKDIITKQVVIEAWKKSLGRYHDAVRSQLSYEKQMHSMGRG